MSPDAELHGCSCVVPSTGSQEAREEPDEHWEQPDRGASLRTEAAVHDWALSALFERFAPMSSAMDDTNHLDPIRADSVGDDEGERRHDELARTPVSATASNTWVRAKSGRRVIQVRRHVSRGGGIVGFDVRDDLFDVSDGCLKPEDIHAIRSGCLPAVAVRSCPLPAPSAMPEPHHGGRRDRLHPPGQGGGEGSRPRARQPRAHPRSRLPRAAQRSYDFAARVPEDDPSSRPKQELPRLRSPHVLHCDYGLNVARRLGARQSLRLAPRRKTRSALVSTRSGAGEGHEA